MYKTAEPSDSSRRSGVHLDTYAVRRAIPIEAPIIYMERTAFSLVFSADVIAGLVCYCRFSMVRPSVHSLFTWLEAR